jgi:hypothetical protein
MKTFIKLSDRLGLAIEEILNEGVHPGALALALFDAGLQEIARVGGHQMLETLVR